MPLFSSPEPRRRLRTRSGGVHDDDDRQPWGVWLLTRTQRLARPVFWYLGAWTLVLIATSSSPAPPRPVGSALRSSRCSGSSASTVILAFVPALVRLDLRRTFGLLVVGLLAATAVCDAARIHFDSMAFGLPNFRGTSG